MGWSQPILKNPVPGLNKPAFPPRGMPRGETRSPQLAEVRSSAANKNDKADSRSDMIHKVQGSGKNLPISKEFFTFQDIAPRDDSRVSHVGRENSRKKSQVSISFKVKKMSINMFTKFDTDSDALTPAEFLEVCNQRANMFFWMLRPQNLKIQYHEESLQLAKNVPNNMIGVYEFVEHLS